MVQPAQDISCGTKHRPPGQPQPNPLSYRNPNHAICHGCTRDTTLRPNKLPLSPLKRAIPPS